MMTPTEPVQTPDGRTFRACLRYFEQGVVSLDLEFPFEAGWDQVIAWSSQWMNAPELEKIAAQRVRSHVARAEGALKGPYAEWLDETYSVIHLRSVRTAEGRMLGGAEMIERYGSELAQIVRGETTPLAAGEQRELMGSSMSYYPSDLLLAAWMGAVVYDTPEGAVPVLQLLEYANVQLIEYRHYDNILTRVLEEGYDSLENRRGFFARWRLAREAERLDTLRLEVRELSERTQNAIKFLSDMYYARAFQLATVKIGAADYRGLVESKLHTAGEIYQSMVNEFRELRSFLLEVIVIVILLVELVPLVTGKH
ncbi:MAG TPA: hypothetical protein VGP79_08590 [Bryobacteraceae bacterium]|nr:hypothetical protein [Bryobacteraceae bacterium]